MKIELIVKTGKGRRSTEADVDETCEIIENIMNFLEKKKVITNFIALPDGANITLKR